MSIMSKESSSIFDNINHEINQFTLNMNNNFTKHQEVIAKIKERLFCDGSGELEEYREKCNELLRDVQDLSAKELELTTKKQIMMDQLHEDEDCISNLTESIKQLTTEEQKLKTEKEKFQNDLVKKHEALKLAVFHYKTALDIHLAVEKCTETSFLVTVSFFTKSANESNYSVQVRHSEEDCTWELADMHPKLTVYDALAERLHKTQDIQGFLVAVRMIFKTIRDKSNN